MGVPACQPDINDSQHHHHESIGKEPAISQHENVTENYGSHPHNSQSRSQSGCFRDQEQNRHHRLESAALQSTRSRLGGAVDRPTGGEHFDPENRGHVNDVAALLLLHVGQGSGNPI